MKQLHKKINDGQVKDLIARYLQKKIERKDLQEFLDIKKTRFFALVKRFKDDPENFSVSYFRSIPTRTISKAKVKYALPPHIRFQRAIKENRSLFR